MSDWTPVEQVAKDDNGNYMALVNGKWVPAIAGAKNDSGAYVAQLSSPTQTNQAKEKSWTEQVFGEGPQKGMSPMQIVKRLGEAGLTGAVLGAGIGSIGMGVGAGPGALIGATGGLLGEAGEQIAANMDIGRGGQVLTGMAAGSPVGAADLIYSGGKAMAPAIRGALSLVPGTKGYALRRLANDWSKETGLDPSVREAVIAAQQRLRGDTPEGPSQGELANRLFGDSLVNKVQQEKSTLDAASELINKQATEAALQKNQGTSVRRALFEDQTKQAQAALDEALNTGIGKGSSSFDLGSRIRSHVAGINNPEVAARSAEYQAKRESAMNAAKASEDSGEFWAATPEAQAIKDKWINLLKNKEDSAAKNTENLINQIWGTKTVTKEVVDPIASAQTGTPVMKTVEEKVPTYASAEKIDDIVRKLGKVYEKEAPSGYEGIGADLARSLRADLTKGIEGQGGFYDWSGLGAAKQGFKEASEKLARFENKRGQMLLGNQFGSNVPVHDAEKLAKEMLGSESGLQQFTAMLRDPKAVSKYLDEYVRGELRGKNSQQIQKWINDPDNGYVFKALPSLKEEITGHLGKVSSLETKIATMSSAAERQQKRLVDPFVQKSASQFVDKLGILEGGSPTQNNKVLDALLSKRNAPAMMQEASRLIGNIPGMKQNMMDAVAARLSKTSPKDILSEFDSLEPALRGFHGIGDEDIAAMRSRVKQVADSAQKTPTIDTKPSIKKALLGFGARTAGRSILRPAITGRIDTEKDNQ